MSALSAAQCKMQNASRDANNPFFNSKYADLASCWDAIREQLGEFGLAICQVPEGNGEKVEVMTILGHSSGQWISGTITATPMKQERNKGWVPSPDPQSIGSCITYLRRYALKCFAGIAPEDDDGNAASGRGKAAPHPESQEEPSSNWEHPKQRQQRQEKQPPKAAPPAETKKAPAQIDLNDPVQRKTAADKLSAQVDNHRENVEWLNKSWNWFLETYPKDFSANLVKAVKDYLLTAVSTQPAEVKKVLSAERVEAIAEYGLQEYSSKPPSESIPLLNSLMQHLKEIMGEDQHAAFCSKAVGVAELAGRPAPEEEYETVTGRTTNR